MATTPKSRIKEKTISIFLKYRELLLVLPLSISIARIFFSQRRASVFDVVTLASMLIWRFIVRDKPRRPFPRLLIVSVCLYILCDFAGALLSDNQLWELAELRKYVHVFIGALLFALPIEERTRKTLITIFLMASAIAGLQGIWQNFKADSQPHGSLPHSILYAATLALAWGSAFFVIYTKNNYRPKAGIESILLLLVLLFTLGGIICSQSRGVWLGWLIAAVVTPFLYNRQKATVFLVCTIVALSFLFYFNIGLRERAESIIASIFANTRTASADERVELWKGSLMIFREHPLIGVGTGNFEKNIKLLIQEKKLRSIATTMHAHNIYMQALATEGIVGFTILITFLSSMVIWGIIEMRTNVGIGGYLIIYCTILTMVGGLTENNLGTTKYLAAYCFTIGLLGPLSGSQASTGTVFQRFLKATRKQHAQG